MFKELVTDVFFDLDHTLWDFEKNSALTFTRIFSDNGIKVNTADFLKTYAPINLAFWKLYREDRISKAELRYHRLKNTFDTLKYEVSSEIIDILACQYIEYLSSYNHLLPGSLEILRYLKPRYKLHIITNGFQEVQEKKLRNAGILDFFEQIVNSEMAGVKKPHPHIFRLALMQANVTPERSIMIGDNVEADILGAKAVGFHTIHFNAHKEPLHEYCIVIDHLSEIKMYL